MRFRRLFLAFALAVFGAWPSLARADFFYEFANASGVPITTPIPLIVGNTVTLQVYLRETGTNILATENLFGLGVRVTYATPNGVVDVTSAAKNPAFTNPILPAPQITTTFARLNEAINFGSSNVPPEPVITGGSRISIGSFTFRGLAQGTATVVAGNYDTPPTTLNWNSTGTNRELDPLITQGASVTFLVTGVPEPTSLALVGMVGAGFVTGVIRRRKARLTAVKEADVNV